STLVSFRQHRAVGRLGDAFEVIGAGPRGQLELGRGERVACGDMPQVSAINEIGPRNRPWNPSKGIGHGVFGHWHGRIVVRLITPPANGPADLFYTPRNKPGHASLASGAGWSKSISRNGME